MGKPFGVGERIGVSVGVPSATKPPHPRSNLPHLRCTQSSPEISHRHNTAHHTTPHHTTPHGLTFRTLFGPILGLFSDPVWEQLGPGKRHDGTKRVIKSFKDPTSGTCKNLQKTSVFSLFFGVGRLRKRASGGPRRLPRGTQRAPKPQTKRIQKWTPKVGIMRHNFG